MFDGKDPRRDLLTDYQSRFVDAIDELMNGMREDIFNYRYQMWVDHVSGLAWPGGGSFAQPSGRSMQSLRNKGQESIQQPG
ncbi:MAG: hypothetical protein MZV63_15530 [Marinilabiliales bacterium]|nr:hypothetical protein [Marinilabiliales bacterium]